MRTASKKLLLTIIFAALLITASALYLNRASEEDEYEAEVRRLFQKVKADTESLRNLTSTNPINLKVVDISFFQKDTSDGVDELDAAREALYKSLLLVPQNFSIKEYKKERAGLVVAAASAYTLYIVREYFNPHSDDAPRILAHEYTHILQYNRAKHPKFLTMDSQLAWSAFIEGEADLVAELYTSNKTGRLTSTMPMPKPPKSGINKWFVDQLTLFPYIYGLTFAYKIYVAEGWRGLDQAHVEPPTSTAEILYPNLYLSGFKPAYPNNPSPPTSGWRIYYPDVLGAYFFNLFLTRTLDSEEALKATSWWIGDNSTLYLNEEDLLLYWQISLSTDEQAKTLKQMLYSELSGALSKDGRISKIDGRTLAILTQDTKLLIVSASNPSLAEAALRDLTHKGFD
ncbi:MAG: hypothetical protein QXG63_04080 [Nitrososphaerales archaeon]